LIAPARQWFLRVSQFWNCIPALAVQSQHLTGFVDNGDFDRRRSCCIEWHVFALPSGQLCARVTENLGDMLEGYARHIVVGLDEAKTLIDGKLGELSVAFFDTTSRDFEGRDGATLGQRGFSKDFRPQLHQVVLGIVLDGHDRPIASFLWPGNTADVTTLLPVVERLRTRFGIRRACIIADRGMISAATVAELEAQGIDYILGVRERSTAEVRTTVIDDDGVAVPLTIPRQKGETDLAIRDVALAGRRYVLARNPEQARKDAETRTALLASLERKLTQGDKALVGNAGYRRFLADPAAEGFTIDEAKVEADARFDGLFVLRTKTKLTALQVVLRYRNLLAVERAFSPPRRCW
jgi:Transposase DDE domain